MKNLRTSFFILFLSIGMLAISQTNKMDEGMGLPNDLDNKYTPDKTSILSSNTDVSVSNSGNGRTIIKNIVSFDILNLSRSQVTFFYERALNKFFSVQGGIGASIAKDFTQETFIPVGVDMFGKQSSSQYNSSGGYSMSLGDIITNSVSNGPGIFLSGMTKIYFSGEAPEGGFVQIGVTYATSNLAIDRSASVLSNTSYIGVSDYNIKNLNLNFLWGYQFVAGYGKVQFVSTLFGGFGVKKITYTDIVEYPSTYNNNTGTYSQLYYQSTGSKSIVVPTLLFGYSLGVGW